MIIDPTKCIFKKVAVFEYIPPLSSDVKIFRLDFFESMDGSTRRVRICDGREYVTFPVGTTILIDEIVLDQRRSRDRLNCDITHLVTLDEYGIISSDNSSSIEELLVEYVERINHLFVK